MKKNMLLLICGVLVSGSAMAINTSNTSNVNDLRVMLFSENVKAGTMITQKGKSSSGEDCELQLYTSRFGVTLSLKAGKTPIVLFQVSVSAKTSSQYEVINSDEGSMEARQIAMSMDERGNYANQQTLQLTTHERPDEKDFNNVSDITISNQFTANWKTDKKGKRVPDFSKSQPKVGMNCVFTSDNF